MGQEDEMVTPTEHVNRLREIACITLDNAAREIRHAADTIEQLQETCQDLRRENKELRDKLETYGVCSGGIITLFASGIEERDAENERLKAENDKLRELAGAVREFVGDVNCDACSLRSQCDGNNQMACGMELSHHAFEAMRNLGIEADG